MMHLFRTTGITAFRKVGGSLENTELMANHGSASTMPLYDRRAEEMMLDEVERVRF
jgi:hypothetical protein